MTIHLSIKGNVIEFYWLSPDCVTGGSGDSPLFPGLPQQKPNIAKGNATWF
jgi:hypothetical protein